MERPVLYFNNAATSWPKPACVLDLVHKVLSSPCHEAGRTTVPEHIDYAGGTRQAVADLFSIECPDQVVFTSNATDSLNMLINGFVKAHPGRFHVVTSDLEHNSVLRPLTMLSDEGRIDLTIVRSENNHVTPVLLDGAITAATKLAVLSHGSNVVGSLQDISEIGRFLQEMGIYYIVDGAQTAGQTEVDLSGDVVDAYVFTGHKYLFGLQGIGGFYIRDPRQVSSTKHGGTGADSQNLRHPQEMPLKYECGTPNYPGIAALYAGTGFVKETGIHAIRDHTLNMNRFLLQELSREPAIAIHNPDTELPVISFTIHGLDSDDAGLILARLYGIIARTGLHCAPLIHERIDNGTGSIRLSLSYMNTMEECRKVANAIREVASGCR
jgi:cysteine desulfurase family protein